MRISHIRRADGSRSSHPHPHTQYWQSLSRSGEAAVAVRLILQKHPWDLGGFVLGRSWLLAYPWVSPANPLHLWDSCVKGWLRASLEPADSERSVSSVLTRLKGIPFERHHDGLATSPTTRLNDPTNGRTDGAHLRERL